MGIRCGVTPPTRFSVHARWDGGGVTSVRLPFTLNSDPSDAKLRRWMIENNAEKPISQGHPKKNHLNIGHDGLLFVLIVVVRYRSSSCGQSAVFKPYLFIG